jgi:hypothetical protein
MEKFILASVASVFSISSAIAAETRGRLTAFREVRGLKGLS